MPKNPEPDEFGRYRVKQDTGTKFSVSRAPLDGETALDEPASDVAGDPLPPEYPESLSSKSTSGQSADLKKESTNG
jgi:hypothetical protein